VPKSSITWLEIVFGGGSASQAIHRAVVADRLRKIGPTLYTSNFTEADETIITRHLWEIVAHYVPGGVVSRRTAFMGRPAADGTVFLTGPAGRRLDLPGLHLRVEKGPGPLAGDTPFVHGLLLASEPRLLLENLIRSREGAGARRTVSRSEVEARLETILRSRGEHALNALRDAARALAVSLQASNSMQQLDALIGTLLRTRSAGRLQTLAGRARAAGEPIDPERVERFALLARSLQAWSPPVRADRSATGPAFEIAAFFDAYFSNYIEGTEFELDEAKSIVFDGVIPPQRPADAHDILGTYRLVGDPEWLARSVVADRDATAFIGRLREAHAVLLAGRPEAGPGDFKIKANGAGNTLFVAPELAPGTLAAGWAEARALRTPFQRAALVMFVIAEVHPFADGNGRTARAFMNAELVSQRQQRVVIPTVYRDDYLGALRALSRQDDPAPFLLMLDQAQRFSAAVAWDDFASAQQGLTAANAFLSADEGARLRVPRTAV
jgi:hypothetical protein